ncbi:MAG: glycogen debranching protein GlgX [Pseudomonadota bacterium]
MTAGQPHRLGAHCRDDGVDFAVFSAHAERIEVCLFDPESGEETDRFGLPERTGDVWHGFLPGLGAGARYGLRAHGPWRPEDGHRFNARKLLIDPYARELTGPVTFHPSQLGHAAGSPAVNPTPSNDDSAPHVPRAIVQVPRNGEQAETLYPRGGDPLIWEAHLKGVTMGRDDVPVDIRGTFDAFGQPWLVEHLRKLGVTAVELLPVQCFADEPFLLKLGLTNYWGYNPVNFFTPEWRYLGPSGAAGFRSLVDRLHDAGIEVILDVVYNHTAEGDHLGPTLSYRGLDNASYYALERDAPARYVNDAGTGNTLAVHHPFVLRLVLDSLRYWVDAFGVDGFRFDLATTLAREPSGFDPNGGFLDALRQDPVLSQRRLIAEPWDVGPGGYQAGAFPSEFAEWNDAFRDSVRRFWMHEPGAAPGLAHGLLGSAGRFDRPGSTTARSINYVAAHDGFTLADVTRYARRHNEANGEDNRDGHAANHADGCGVDGPTTDPAILATRARRQRNLLFTLLFSQGTPMLLAGDEWGNSQQGNNNAYCQDNPIGWLDWSAFDDAFFDFACRLTALRRAHPALRQLHYLHGGEREQDGHPDVRWLAFAGGEPDWHDTAMETFALVVRMSSELPVAVDDAVVIAVNGAMADDTLLLPDPPTGAAWYRCVDTAHPDAGTERAGPKARVAADSAVLFARGAAA